MSQFANRARMTVVGAPGTAAFALSTNDTGAQSFADAGITNGVEVSYAAESPGKLVWEYGRGIYTAAGTLLSRTPIRSSAGLATLANFPAGTKVQVTLLAEDTGNTKEENVWAAKQTFSVLPVLAAVSGYIKATAGVLTAVASIAAADITAAGSPGQVQYNVAGALGAANVWVEDANTLALRNGVTAQSLLVHNLWTDVSNYERGVAAWSANVFEVGTQAAGTGTLRDLKLTAAKINTNTEFVYGDSSLQLGNAADGSFLVSTGYYSGSTWEAHIRLTHVKTDAYIGFELDGINDETDINVTTGGGGNYYSAYLEPRVLDTDTKTGSILGLYGGPRNYSTNTYYVAGIDFSANSYADCPSLYLYGSSAIAYNQGAVSDLTIIGSYVRATSNVDGTTATKCIGLQVELAFSGAGSSFAEGCVGLFRSDNTSADFIKCTNAAGSTVYSRVDGRGRIILTNGSMTTSQPAFDAAQTWNAGGVTFTALKVNITDTASAAASLLMDLQVGGASKFSIGKAGDVTLADAANIIVNTTTGTKIGTATTQKLGFWNATPVAQQAGTGETVGFTAGAGTAVNDASTFTGNVGATAYRISDVVKALKNIGLLAA